jgi:hypothetical protein
MCTCRTYVHSTSQHSAAQHTCEGHTAPPYARRSLLFPAGHKDSARQIPPLHFDKTATSRKRVQQQPATTLITPSIAQWIGLSIQPETTVNNQSTSSPPPTPAAAKLLLLPPACTRSGWMQVNPTVGDTDTISHNMNHSAAPDTNTLP